MRISKKKGTSKKRRIVTRNRRGKVKAIDLIYLARLKEKVGKYVKICRILNFQKTPIKIKMELLKTLGISQILYSSFIFHGSLATKKEYNAFQVLYNRIIRETFNLKSWCNREQMYKEFSLPDPKQLIAANMLGVIDRLQRNFKGTLIGEGS